MDPVDKTYRKSFFYHRKSLIWRAPILCKIIMEVFGLGKRSTIIDVGCAIGEYVAEFNKQGLLAKGLEGSTAAMEYFLPNADISVFDIRTELPGSKLTFGKFYDLCMSLEVAEHIEPKYVDVFLNNLCFLSKKILISAAPPGQQGHGHHNCQPKEYWEIKFGLRGYRRNVAKEKRFEKLLEPYKKKKGLNAYYQNTMIYEEE